MPNRLQAFLPIMPLKPSARLALLVCVFTTAVSAQTESFTATVSRITDGDTFRLHGVDAAIRVWGLDAPERDETGGTNATQTMTALIEGQTLTCQVRDIDRFGRIVGQCFLPNGRDIAAEMIRLGAAAEYCRFSRGYYQTC